MTVRENIMAGESFRMTWGRFFGAEHKAAQERAQETLKRIGLDTAKSVLKLGREDMVRRTDLEEETIDEVISVLSKEFE